jgi:hypothetical protein
VCHLDASTSPIIDNVWYDLSGYGHHATADNNHVMPKLVELSNNGVTFKALRFDGKDDGMALSGNVPCYWEIVVPRCLPSLDKLVIQKGYTIYIVNQYYDNEKGRTLQSRNINWLLGLWGGNVGHYAEGWVHKQPAQTNCWFICGAMKEDENGTK